MGRGDYLTTGAYTFLDWSPNFRQTVSYIIFKNRGPPVVFVLHFEL